MRAGADLPGADRLGRARATASAGCSRRSATSRPASPRPARGSGSPRGATTVVQVLKTLHTTHGGKLSVARVLDRPIGDGAELIGPDGPGGPRVRRLPPHGPAGRRSATRRRPARPSGSASSTAPRPAMTLSTGKAAPRQIVDAAAAGPGARHSPSPRPSARTTSSFPRRCQKAVEEDPSLRVTHAQDTGETRDRRAGRDAPPRRAGAAHRQVRRRRQDARAARPLQGDHPRRGQRARPPQEAVGRPRPVRRRGARHQAAAARRRLRVRARRSPAAWCRGTTSRRSRRASRNISARARSAFRWSMSP